MGKSRPPSRRIPSGRFERQLSLTRMGLLAGSRFALQSARDFLAPGGDKAGRRREQLGEQAPVAGWRIR